ncbi:bifunctional D-glycero-beta-D-manno-heptose-7-phosphate kinase/D-glycero-beta-D-manno-heptose 1-phosphate adenylyltransferase HldE [Occallatibacter savannae]|uniref:bifunctional D-glycero-beta-D-manno-heptose-7-phosphate kinase/D-glycero-beta-D-manno-heptose 1-phosphate adenylyltransferase HldE n=1 Tax=Occallatibacter savannae TaxID=1002691 RepID=UPI000D69055F|nr:bifunctional D-glycero-beta-D-manno-heptose-7-phosphate kinase/D-glycero-beta-D-manno-heptose 1-phosphate adenylyltransferase HldE [Occallatibacter savannae]
MLERLDEIIRDIEQGWRSRRLLVVGDVMIDKYVWGEVSRISPEAPVPVVHFNHQSHQPGGAANVAMNLVRLGAEVLVVGYTGDDEDEKLLLSIVSDNGITARFVQCREFPTITKLRIVGGKQQMLRLDRERLGPRSAEDQQRLIDTSLQHISSCHAVILSDYAKGVLTPEVCQSIICAAREAGIPILVDPKSTDFSRYAGASTICPNLNELSRASGLETRDLDVLLDAAQQMVSKYKLDFLTATLSEKGIALVRSDRRTLAAAKARQVFDVSGAGDTVVAVLALSLASGLSPEIAIRLANVAAGVVVEKVGTVPIEKHEFLAALTPELALQAHSKVVSRDELAMRVALWKQNGERVVFTNGCFDLLHIGHITVIEQARQLGDRLIVAINSDRSVSRLKGPDRPIVDESARARVLAALGSVDAVTVFDDPTPLQLVFAVRPDVIVKGGDYNPETVVGAREVQSWGGEVRIVPTVEGFSTTRLIEKSKR